MYATGAQLTEIHMATEHLYLTGFRGTGKTSVGAVLAKKLGRSIIDLDQVIEANAGKSIREIFDEGGEPLFRKLELEALTVASENEPSVISLGGGAILRAENREILSQTGCCFWLDADAETIAERINNDSTSANRRPALTSLEQKEEIRQLLAKRRDLYDQSSDHRIETNGRSIDEVANEILELLPSLKQSPS